MLRLTFALFATLGLMACATEPSGNVDPITAAVSGKTLVADNAAIVVGADGSLGGMVGPNKDIPFAGAWTVRDGQWCRTITLPESAAGTACQDATVNADGTLTIDGLNGPTTFAVQ